jgi:hypothetical protein
MHVLTYLIASPRHVSPTSGFVSKFRFQCLCIQYPPFSFVFPLDCSLTLLITLSFACSCNSYVRSSLFSLCSIVYKSDVVEYTRHRCFTAVSPLFIPLFCLVFLFESIVSTLECSSVDFSTLSVYRVRSATIDKYTLKR